MGGCLVKWKVDIQVRKRYHFVSLSQYCTQYPLFFPLVFRAPHRRSLHPGHGPDFSASLASRATIIVLELIWVNGIAENMPA